MVVISPWMVLILLWIVWTSPVSPVITSQFDNSLQLKLGKFWYVVADIVVALNPLVKLVGPYTGPPVNVAEGKLR